MTTAISAAPGLPGRGLSLRALKQLPAGTLVRDRDGRAYRRIRETGWYRNVSTGLVTSPANLHAHNRPVTLVEVR